MKKLAVILFNLGGPLNNEDVKPFLYNLFSDRNIISLPFGARQFVARMISSSREKSAQANYKLMGGGSPIVAETEAQARALKIRLEADFPDTDIRVIIAMRYWNPMTEAAIAEVEAFDPDQIVLLPLYPQYSTTTTYSSVERFLKLYKGRAPVSSVCCYPENPSFIEAHAEALKKKIKTLKNKDAYRILFSAHGLPEKIVKAGDPYVAQVEATVAAVMKALGPGLDHIICYQSRVGPLKWVGPSTEEAIRETAEQGRNIILSPIAFVSEHIETLVELDIEYAHLARDLGVADYVRVPALKTDALFISALAEEVARAVSEGEGTHSEYTCAACHSRCLKQKGLAR